MEVRENPQERFFRTAFADKSIVYPREVHIGIICLCHAS